MEQQPVFRGVLFDMDGVIIDSLEEVERFWIPRLAKKGIALSEREFLEKLHGRPAVEVIEEFFADKTDQERKELHREGEKFDREHTIRLVPGIKEMLNSLRDHKIPVGLVTSALLSKVKSTFKTLGADSYFSAVVTSADVKKGKPHPECYQEAAQTLGLNVEECIVFEDSVNGIRSADAAGAFVVGVNNLIFEDLLKQEGARTVIPDFEEIELQESGDGVFIFKSQAQAFSIRLTN